MIIEIYLYDRVRFLRQAFILFGSKEHLELGTIMVGCT